MTITISHHISELVEIVTLKKTVDRNQIHRVAAFAMVVLVSVVSVGGWAGTVHDEREIRLTDVRQLTFGGENAEAYWSPDGAALVFQSTRAPNDCDQIYRMPLKNPTALSMVSNGLGRTTCGYFTCRSKPFFAILPSGSEVNS